MKRIAFYLMAAAVVLTTSCKDKDVAVEKVTLNKTTLELTVDAKETLVATIDPSDATNKTLVWSSDKDNIASVTQSGEVAGKAAGTATITITAHNGVKATCAVTVKAATVAVTGVTLNKTEIELLEGDKFDLVATVEPSNATNKNVTWSSDDTKIATVDNTGKVTAVAKGTTSIVVVTSEKGFTKECKVVVKPVVKEVTLNVTTRQIVKGYTFQLVATVTPDDAPEKEITWTSEKPEIATVSVDGLVTAITLGQTTIKATAPNGKFASATIEVVNAVSFPESTFKLLLYEAQHLRATSVDEFVPLLKYESSDPTVATVNNKGVVNALKVGETTITVSITLDGELITATRKVEVVKLHDDWNEFECDENPDPAILALFHGGSSKIWTWDERNGNAWGIGPVGDKAPGWWSQPLDEMGPIDARGAYMTFKSDGTMSKTNTFDTTFDGTYCITTNYVDIRDDWSKAKVHVTVPLLNGIRPHGEGEDPNKVTLDFMAKYFYLLKLTETEMVLASPDKTILYDWDGAWYWIFRKKD